MHVVVYAIVMFLIFPLGTPCLYTALLYASRQQIGRIRRAEVTAKADETKLKQRKLSVDLSARASARQSESARAPSSRWTARASRSMQSMVESETTQRHDAQELRSMLSPAVRQLTDGCLFASASNRMPAASGSLVTPCEPRGGRHDELLLV